MPIYSAYGLEIDSELLLPWLLPGSKSSPDVTIRLGSVPEALTDPLGKGGYYEATLDTFLFRVRNVANYLVAKGQEIIVDRAPDGPNDLLYTFLMGSAFGALMHQRRLLVMHASSIETAGGAVLFVGPSGQGKSTLLAALVDRGYAMLADDVTAIDVERRRPPLAFSSFPRMRLGPDTVSRIGYRTESLSRVQNSDKYLVPVENFCSEALPVRAVFDLSVHEAPKILVEPVDTLQRFGVVSKNTYRYKFLDALGLRQMHFHAAAEVAKAVSVGKISRPASPFMLKELVDRLAEELGAPLLAREEMEAR